MIVRLLSGKIYFIFILIVFGACTAKKETTMEKPEKVSFWIGDTTSLIHGLDISHHQKIIDWDKAKESGLSFVFVKATEGIDYLDSMFVFNWTTLEKEGIIRGAYHFYVSDDDPVKQAEWFVQNVGSFENTLPPVVDVERAGHEHVTHEIYLKRLMECLEYLEVLTGRRPIIYSSPHFAEKYLTQEDIGKFELWIAEYEVDAPTIPQPWQQKEPGWRFWQYTFQDTVPGVPARVDRNVFADKYDRLVEMVSQ